MHDRLRNRILIRWADLVARHAGTIIAVAVILAVSSVLFSLKYLGFQSNRNDLIDAEIDWNKRFIAWQDTFPGSTDLVVVVDTQNPNSQPEVSAPSDTRHAEAAREFVRVLGTRLDSNPHVKRVVWGLDQDEFSPRAMRLLEIDEFNARLEEMRSARPLLEFPSPAHLLEHAVDAFEDGGSASRDNPFTESPAETENPDQIAELTRLVRAIDGALRTSRDEPLSVDELLQEESPSDAQLQMLTSPNGRLLFILVTPRMQEGALNAFEETIAAIRADIAASQREFKEPIEAGLTGIEVIETDETVAATRDSAIASSIAFVLISILLIWSFASWRMPILAVSSLLIGMAWSFGYLTLAIGHLQVLSVVFCIILLGLGIDFAIHLSTGYELLRHDFADGFEGFKQALRQTFTKSGPGVITGAVTTSAAFLTTLPTDFTGVAEMGHIAAAGVALCLIAMFTVFPALLRFFKRDHTHVKALSHRRAHIFEERWVLPFVRRPLLTLVATGILTAGALAYAVTHVRYDYDLIKLQPAGAPSVIWANRVTEDGEQSIWHAVSIVDSLEEARTRAAAFRELPTVQSDLGGVGLLFPEDESLKIGHLKAMRLHLRDALDAAGNGPEAGDDDQPQVVDELRALRGRLTEMNMALAMPEFMRPRELRDMPAETQADLAELSRAVDNATAHAAQLGDAERSRRIDRMNEAYAAYRSNAAQRIRGALDTAPIHPDDLPQILMAGYRNDRGQFAIEVNPKLPIEDGITSPYDPRFLPRFIADLESVDPSITGVPIQIYKSGELIRSAYTFAGLLALAIVFVLVLADFRSIHDALISLFPVAVGFTLTFALIEFAGESINAANIIVLPLMFGIGVDAGVHVLHRARQDPDHRPIGLTAAPARGSR